MLIVDNHSKNTMNITGNTVSSVSLCLDVDYVSGDGDFDRQEIEKDIIFNYYMSTTSYLWGRVIATGLNIKIYQFKALNSVADVDEDGYLYRNRSGIARIGLKQCGIVKGIDVDMRDTNDIINTKLYVGPVSGSLLEDIIDQIDSRITDVDITNINMYTEQNHDSKDYLRNTDLWCSDVDATCISPWNSRGANKRAGTLITKRHYICAAHYPLSVGDTIRFIGNDNTVYDRTVLAVKTHPNYIPYSPDINIGVLDEDLPDDIKPCMVLPNDITNHLSLESLKYALPPVLGLDQNERMTVVDLYNLGVSLIKPKTPNRLSLYKNKIDGDSGNPIFFIINDELVLITVLTTGYAGGGTPIYNYIDDINQLIVDVDTQAGNLTGYAVSEVDLSGFPSY